jgi:alanine racemase
MTRPARVTVDLDALRHNLQRVRALAPGSRIMAIVKADAYGHGIERAARALTGADAFGVSCLEEAQRLRDAGVLLPVVLLEGPFAATEFKDIVALKLETVIHSPAQLEMLSESGVRGLPGVWLKVDSGMHRLGFDPDDVRGAWDRLRSESIATGPIRLMTHLARAGIPGDTMTSQQLRRFAGICAGLPGERSAANSAAILSCPDSHGNWVRPGLMLYGVSPMTTGQGGDLGLRPAMTLSSELISVRRVRAGEPVGYGAAWICPEDMPIGVVAAGYGDGFPRHARSGTPILVDGRRCAIIGFPSMDMLAVDLRNAPDAVVGTPVELWGPDLPIEEIATQAGTVAYELLCGVHRQRLSFRENGPG